MTLIIITKRLTNPQIGDLVDKLKNNYFLNIKIDAILDAQSHPYIYNKKLHNAMYCVKINILENRISVSMEIMIKALD